MKKIFSWFRKVSTKFLLWIASKIPDNIPNPKFSVSLSYNGKKAAKKRRKKRNKRFKLPKRYEDFSWRTKFNLYRSGLAFNPIWRNCWA